MASIGGLLVVLGAGSLIMPIVGFQLTLMAPLDPLQPFAGIAAAVIGAGLIGFAGMRQAEPESRTPTDDDGSVTA